MKYKTQPAQCGTKQEPAPAPRADVQDLPQAAPRDTVCVLPFPGIGRQVREDSTDRQRDQIPTQSIGLVGQGREPHFVTVLQSQPCDLLRSDTASVTQQ